MSMEPLRPLAADAGGPARLVTSYSVTLSNVFHLIGVSRSAIEAPSEVVYLSDGIVEIKGNTAFYNHGARLNVLHVDGSVKNYANTHIFPSAVRPKP